MDDTSSVDFNDTIQSTTVKQKPKKLPTECKICRASAVYSYFGVIACPSCKMFFKRTVQKKQDRFKCVYDGHCEINILNRRNCTSCRLAKCFASGMQADLIRSSRTPKKNTNQKKQPMRISTISSTRKEKDQPQQLRILNLVRSNQSILTADQWNLLSNLTHCYDEYGGFSLVQCYIREQNQLPPKMRFKLESVDEFFTAITSAGQLLYIKNADFISLCSHDRSVLLHNSMKYVAGLGACFITRHTRLLDNPALYKSAEVLYGSGTLVAAQRAIDQLDFDSTFIKLILALLSFSTFHYVYYTSNTPGNLENIQTVFHIHDMYTELAWRYLLYKFGNERAVICFSKLVRCLFLVHHAILEIDDCKQYTDMINFVVKGTEEILTLTE